MPTSEQSRSMRPLSARPTTSSDVSRAVVATTRFGWGVSPGLVAKIATDPDGWLNEQIAAGVPKFDHELTSPQSIALASQTRRLRRADDPSVGAFLKSVNQTVHSGQVARIALAQRTDRPFVDRWVAFWTNHFAVSARGGQIRAAGAPYELDAIRPHALGRFEDLLLAVASHPAMLLYLDNANSVGPNSRAGTVRGRGLNENFGRELLELHTLGVRGGYTQRDVEELSLALTGWTVRRAPMRLPMEANEGAFVFHPRTHEPGERQLLGQRYPEGGKEQAEAMLRDLAHHPATADHIARKIANYFVGPSVPSALTERLARDFQRTKGDLASLAQTLIGSEEAWSAPAERFLPPFDFVVAVGRAFPGAARMGQTLRALRGMGQPLWAPRSPEGYAHENAEWLGPEGLKLRLAYANMVADRMDPGTDVPAYARSLYGDAIDPRLMVTLQRAEAARQGFTLLIMSPTFLRR